MSETSDEFVARLVKSIIDEADRVEEAIIDAIRQSGAHVTRGDDHKITVDGPFDMKAVVSAAINTVDSD